MTSKRASARRRWMNAAAQRPGMTVIVVLGVISITLALSYAMLRSQVTSVEIQSNLERHNLARQAAYAGISAALRDMHSSSWAGVDSTLSQDLATEQWYEVSYNTGDTSLTSTSADYSEYPFRVTINSIGYAADPAQSDVRSSYKVRAVVEMIRKSLQTAPTSWQFARNYTVYQWSGSSSAFEMPMRLEGPLWLQGAMAIGADYPIDSSSRTQYYNDLTAMKTAGLGDYRPFNGPIYTPSSRQTTTTKTFLQTGQQLTLVDAAISSATPATYPTQTTLSYQLYPGGKTYTLPNLQATYGNMLTGVTIAPDPVTNPLGLYQSSGTLHLDTNTNITGTIVTTGSDPDIRVRGKNVTLQAYTLPMLSGSTVPYQLPVAIVKDDFQVQNDATCTIRGAVFAWDEFVLERGDAALKCDLKGKVFCSKLYMYGRSDWDLPLASWQAELLAFNAQKGAANGIKYFPQYMKQTRGFDYDPLLTIKADASNIVYHWNTFGQPMYIAGSEDDGLRWNLIDWIDNPSN